MKHLVEFVFSAGLFEALAAAVWLGLLVRICTALAFGGLTVQVRRKGNDE